jgi:hypothetical protein
MRFTSFTRTPPSNSGEESGLSESAYEIIGTDSEENYAESMGESIGSLDFHRPDDVRSLADTEHTDGDDESVADEPLEGNSTYDVVNTERDEMDESQLEGAITEALGLDCVPSPQSTEKRGSIVDREAVRTSADYTRRSLQSPSMSGSEMTEIPEASKSWPPREQKPQKPAQPKPMKPDNNNNNMWTSWRNILQPSYRQQAFLLSMALTSGLFGLLGLYLAPRSYVYNTAVSVPAVDIVTTTYEPVPETTTSLSVHPSGDLITVEDAPSDEWRFGYKQPTVDMMPLVTRNGDVFVWIPPDVQKAWLSKGCVTITATKHDTFIDTIISAAENGIVIKFPSEPAHGTINLTLATTCRPKVHKVMTVDFGQSTVETLLERSRQLRSDLSDLLQPAAQNFGDFMHSLGSLPQQIRNEATMWSNHSATAKAFSDTFGHTFEHARQSTREAWALARKPPAVLCDMQEQAETSLLNAQISAALWWYKITGRIEEANEYRHKASKLMKERAASPSKAKPASEPAWSGFLRKLTKPECQGRSRMCSCRSGEGLCSCRGPAHCKPVR